MSNDYRIEKSRCPVVVTTRSGDQLAGDMFLQLHSQRRAGPEAPGDLLNDDDPFFPIVLEDGETLLLAKRRLLEVVVPDLEAPDQDEAIPDAGVRFAPVEVVLTGGVHRTGTVKLELPFERPRLLDYLNRYRERFVTLYAEDGVRLLNRRCIERVRPLD